MSTFGEITEPSSRASWEDWDDVASDYNLPELHWQNPLEIPEAVDLFIFEGNYLWQVVAKDTNKKIQEINCIKEANVHLFKSPESNNYICVTKDCDLMLSNDVVKLLKDLIVKSKTVMTMQVKPITEYQTTQTVIQPCVIRKITTTNTSNLFKINHPKLEQPNIISGVSAGVVSLREILGLSASVMVFYIEHSQENKIEGMQSLLQNLQISQTSEVNPNIVMNSNLYI